MLSGGCHWVAGLNVADMLQASSQHIQRLRGPCHHLSLDPALLQPVRCMSQYYHSHSGHAKAVAVVQLSRRPGLSTP